MLLKKLAEPFQHEKIDVTAVQQKQEGSKNKPRKSKNWAGTLSRIWSYLTQNKWKLVLVLIMVVISSVMALLGPFIVGMALDHYIVPQQFEGLGILLIGLLAVYMIHSISVWLQNFWMVRIAQNTVYTMRTNVFKHLHKLPIPYFDRKQHGELMSRVTNDMENVSTTLNTSVIQIFASILTLVGTISVMFYLSWILTLITLLVVPAMVFGMKWITKRTGVLFKAQQRNMGILNGHIQETMSGQRIIKTFSQEEKVIAEFKEKNDALKKSGFWAQTISGFIPKLMNFLNNLSFAIIAGVGALLAIVGDGIVTIGMIVIFVELSRQFTRPLNDLANQFNTLLSAIAGAERVFEVLDEDVEMLDEKEASELSNVIGEVQFENVSFSYEDDEDTVNNISFHAKPGETIAFVGPTGAGKTTMINLLSRFYDKASGRIYIDGKEIQSIKRESLRKHMAFVLQDSFLFEGSIRENIRYGRLTASDREIEEAAKQANAHSFIMKLPEKYDTVLSPDGGGISQGQKQLLSIARAILANPKILILDEATSSIDTVTEIRIQEALQRLMEGRTSFVIAHRLNTIQKADNIIVLKEGEIFEQGSHDELLKQQGFYADLYHSQLKTRLHG
ncbi:ABC transporter ATP-binding protein [Evansella cellulosilytica]|uniref:ABC transporter related protein n=1 Tax=Evansella cellulosilytica (strain ATCC 21833 / DSM 2522 / FERM P-1141 / JCM 9156 / N-4) TaxID=649639 RepID=E6U009_EVAC2|nr:ABC transporter ATP-binding protein [Evansella cellulosilytica]ADU29013.1 ABC transporter related protein [Evansella cellulosilytica DSM 2522]